MNSEQHGKNLDIEVLRAVAILGTLFSHLDILLFWGSDWLNSLRPTFFMWGGVDLFFCISGYVIVSGLFRSLRDGRSTFSAFAIPFWIKRAWRILPSAWLWMIVPLMLSVFFNTSRYLGTPAGNIVDSISIVAQLANLHTWSCYAHPGTLCGINQVYWSLSLEEQSYLLLPFILFFANRRLLVPLLIALVLVQIFLPRPILSFLWFVRTDALMLGAILAIAKNVGLLERLDPRILSNNWLASSILILLCVLIALIPGALVSIPFHTGMLAIVSFLMVWIASYDKGYTLHDGLLKKVMAYVGSRSYAVYLIHVPIYRATREIWLRLTSPQVAFNDRYTVSFVMTALVLTFLLAELNFRFIEAPLRKRGVRIADQWMNQMSSAKHAPSH
ncbi:acyltransferase family protein [Burkholderia oklahomensis]|uniref:Acyltransferase family protein n=1 Tax=Burkholderia oklahomensis TaxID=342113 RepID=A0AAI8FPM6_9BURK|nr:acyltransferase [Burkholderia oklahomensis]AIO68791.1 acyltransferase family protein [Burkholderia oklahomensis]AOI38676.1 acyltransferase [Burkholderia oklahomensis EO147]KUY64762.1 acyltransferase [Burkholderia oklahomensis EO147]QPS40977.1 acyltransferase [Burkholderia oklahomensis]